MKMYKNTNNQLKLWSTPNSFRSYLGLSHTTKRRENPLGTTIERRKKFHEELL